MDQQTVVADGSLLLAAAIFFGMPHAVTLAFYHLRWCSVAVTFSSQPITTDGTARGMWRRLNTKQDARRVKQ